MYRYLFLLFHFDGTEIPLTQKTEFSFPKQFPSDILCLVTSFPYLVHVQLVDVLLEQMDGYGVVVAVVEEVADRLLVKPDLL